MAFLLLTASAIMPALLLFWYFWAKDKNPEPRGALLKTFFGGVLICFPVVFVVHGLEGYWAGAEGMWPKAFTKAFFGAGIPEESFKLLVLLTVVWRNAAFDEKIDGMIYGVTASLGFATLENVLYVSTGGLGTAVMRAVTAVPCHAFLGVIMGAFLTKAKFGPKEQALGFIATGLVAAIVLHGLYDMFLFTQSGWAVCALVVLAVMVRWGRTMFLRERDAQLTQVTATTAQVVVAMASADGVVSAASVRAQSVRTTVAPPPARSWGARFKIFFGGVGLTACSLVAVALVAVAFDGKTEMLGIIILGFMTFVPGAISFWLFRAGLRAPMLTPMSQPA